MACKSCDSKVSHPHTNFFLQVYVYETNNNVFVEKVKKKTLFNTNETHVKRHPQHTTTISNFGCFNDMGI